jgi:membrane protease YdiL (CAAX protease family)
LNPSPPQHAGPVVFAEAEAPFWGFAEIFVAGAVFVVAANVLFEVGVTLLHNPSRQPGYWALTEEFAAYVLLFLLLRVLFARYGQPLFRSLAWIPHSFSPAHLALVGLFLSVTVLLLQQFVLRMPDVETPFDKLLVDTPSRIVIALFGVTLGPVIEELLFRGFLQPVLVRVAGVFPGILITAALFGAMHLEQNAGLWQSGVLITLVGFVLGVIRHVSGSTRASSITHMAYNSLPCIALLFQGIQPNHK